MAKPATIPLEAEDNATITIDKVRAEAEKLNKQRAEFTIGADDTEGKAKLLAIDMRLEKLNKYLARPGVELQGLDHTLLGIYRIDAAMNKLNGKTATVKVETKVSKNSNILSRVLSGFGGGGDSSGGGGGAFSGPFKGISGAGSGASAGAIEAVTSPVGAAATAAALPFLGTGIAGGLLGGLGVGLAGIGIAGGLGAGSSRPRDVEAAQNTLHAAQLRVVADQLKLNKLRSSGKASTAQLATAEATLARAHASVTTAQEKILDLGPATTKPVIAAQEAFRHLSDNAKASLATIGASFAPVMTTIFNVANSTLGKMTPVFAAAEKTISGPFQQVGVILAKSIASPAVVTSINNLAKSFGAFLVGFSPQIPGIVNAIANGINGMATAFTDHPGMIKGMGSVLAFLLKLPGFVAGAMGSLTRVTAWLIGGLPHAVSIGLDAAREFFINIGHGIETVWNSVWGNVKGTTSQGASVLSSFWTTITGPFIAGYNFVLSIFNNIKNFITNSFDKWWATNGAAVIQVWNTIWTNVRDVVVAILYPTIAVVKVGMGLLVVIFKTAWATITTAAKLGWDVISGLFKIGMSIIGAIFRVGWAAISLIFKSAIGILVASWNIFWSIISNVAKLAWTTVKNIIKGVWDVIVGLFGIFINLITGHWGAALTDMKNMASQIWNLIKSQLSAIWNAIRAIGIAIWNSLRGYLIGLWNNIRSAGISIWNAFKNGVVGVWHSVVSIGKSIWSNFFGWLRSGWHAVVNSASVIWNGIKAAVSAPVKWVINNVWDRFAGIINTATNFLHLGKPLPVVHMAEGGLLGGYGGGDRIPALLEAGETVVDKKRSKMFSSIFKWMGVPGHATGGVVGGGPPINLHTGVSRNVGAGPGLGDIGNVFKTVGGWAKNLVQGAILGVVKPLVNSALGLLSHMPGGSTTFGKMIAQFPRTIANHFFDWIGGKDKAFTAAQVKNVGAGVARWAGLVNKALSMLGLPLSLASRVLYQMQTESGGNPNAINNTDINAQHGDPSRGLMQTIGATFRAYHVAGTSNNIYDPLANIAAAINYARHVYGPSLMSGGRGMGSGHGYYMGTQNATRGWHMVGENGPELAFFHGSEKVIPNSRIRGGDGSSAPVVYNINVTAAPLSHPADTGRAVVGAIKEFEKRSGKSWRS